jgi:hypothetical protein
MSTDQRPDSMTTADAIPAPDGVAISAPQGSEEPPVAQGDVSPPAESAATAATATTTATSAVTATPAAAATPIAVSKDDRARLSALVIGKRLLTLAITVALLGGGIYAGLQYYNTTHPAPVTPGDPAVLGVPTPPIVAELASAIDADDPNAIRVTLNAEMFSRYTADMERFGIASIDGVTTLGTFADGPRTATALVILGRSTDRNPFTINLVVIAQDGQIVRLR